MVTKSEPTSFAPIIQKAIEISQNMCGREVILLVILTDGQTQCFELDKQAVIEASNHPISICVVGVGSGLFTNMIELDDMEGQRRFDNFQFVDYSKLEGTLGGQSPELQLITAMFNELPEHFDVMRQLGYM